MRFKETKAVPAKPGTWKARHYDRPDLYNPDGSWRAGVDRMAIHPPLDPPHEECPACEDTGIVTSIHCDTIGLRCGCGTGLSRDKIKALDEHSPGWRDMTYPNGKPMFTAKGVMLDEHGARSIFDDVDE